jgi:hypothetical protein
MILLLKEDGIIFFRNFVLSMIVVEILLSRLCDVWGDHVGGTLLLRFILCLNDQYTRHKRAPQYLFTGER